MIFSCYGNVLIKYSPPRPRPCEPLSNAEVISSPAVPGLAGDPSGCPCSAPGNLARASYSRNRTRSQGQASDLLSLKYPKHNTSLLNLDGGTMVTTEGSGETWSRIHTHNTWKDFLKPLGVCTQKHYTLLTNILHSSQPGMLDIFDLSVFAFLSTVMTMHYTIFLVEGLCTKPEHWDESWKYLTLIQWDVNWAVNSSFCQFWRFRQRQIEESNGLS